MGLLSSLIDEHSVRLSDQTNKTEIYIAIRRDVPPAGGAGTRENPYNGSGMYDSNFTGLDFVLRELEDRQNIRLLFGPGIYKTRGGPPNVDATPNFGFAVLNGQEFIGAGIGKTIIRLQRLSGMSTNSTGARYPVFGSGLAEVNDIFISDLTIDCDFEHQAETYDIAPPNQTVYSYPYPRYTVSGILLDGSNIRLRRRETATLTAR